MSSPTHHITGKEWHTPQRAIVIHERFDNEKGWKKIENDTGIPIRTARRWCTAYKDAPARNLRRRCHDPAFIDYSGAPLKITNTQVREMELILEAYDDDHPVETKALTWL